MACIYGMTFVPLLANGASLPCLLNYPNFPYIYIFIYITRKRYSVGARLSGRTQL